MSRFLVVTWDGAGNLVPTFGIAQRLAQQGHDVRLLGHRSIQARGGDHGWRFRPFAHTADFDSAARLEPEAEMPLLTEQLWFSGAVAGDVREELAREPADVLVGDCMLFGALCAGQSAGLPTVALFHAPFSLFRGGPLVEMMAPAIPAINGIRADLGLPPVERISEVHDACDLSLAASLREFERDMPMPPNVRFVGPVLDAPALMPGGDDVDIEDGSEPLVVISMSTGYQGQAELLQRIVDALADLPASVVVTTGGAIDPGALNAPGNTQIARFVPHDRLFSRASLVITHAGHGTMMTALSHGVPLLCIPMGRDQFLNAANVEMVGAGHTIGADADSGTIADAARRLLDDHAARASSKRMATVIAGYGGAADAVLELERLAGP